jgi:hypothetical protein
MASYFLVVALEDTSTSHSHLGGGLRQVTQQSSGKPLVYRLALRLQEVRAPSGDFEGMKHEAEESDQPNHTDI